MLIVISSIRLKTYLKIVLNTILNAVSNIIIKVFKVFCI
jgi:hypothetical protein